MYSVHYVIKAYTCTSFCFKIHTYIQPIYCLDMYTYYMYKKLCCIF